MKTYIRLKDGASITVDEKYLTESTKKRLGSPSKIAKPTAIKEKESKAKTKNDESNKS